MRHFTADQAKDFESRVSQVHRSVEILNTRVHGRVVSYSDQWFADAANLLTPTPPVRDATRFTHSGAWYDGWETRRHNAEEYDWVIIRAGVHAARVIGCEIDTTYFNGNHGPAIAVQGLFEQDVGSLVEEQDARWADVIGKVACGPSQRQFFLRDQLTDHSYNYFKLKMYPDGGISRFRLYGKVIPPPIDPMSPDRSQCVDLCNIINGAVAIAVSDEHFGSVNNLIMPGRGCDMSDGWETARSRVPGHVDWAILQLGKPTNYVDRIVVDTAHFRGNFPQYVSVHGIFSEDQVPSFDDPSWIELVGKSKTGPDQEHKYAIEKSMRVSHVKLTIIPDGGVKRLRLFGL